MNLHIVISSTLVSLLVFSPVLAQDAPRLLPFQGRLTDQNGVAVSNGVRLVQFKIFDVPSGGSPVWAGELHRTTVNGGLVNVLLGSKTPLTGVIFENQLYLEITLDVSGPEGLADNAITAADPPMLPRQVILPAVFAQESRNTAKLLGYDWSALLANGSTNPQTGKISGSRIVAASITGEQVAPQSIQTQHLDQSVTQQLYSILLEIKATQAAVSNVAAAIALLGTAVTSLSNSSVQIQAALEQVDNDVKNNWVVIATSFGPFRSFNQTAAEIAQWQYAVLYNGTFCQASITFSSGNPSIPLYISTEQVAINGGGFGTVVGRHVWTLENITSYYFRIEDGETIDAMNFGNNTPINVYKRRR